MSDRPVASVSDFTRVMRFYATFFQGRWWLVFTITFFSICGDLARSVLTPLIGKRLVDTISNLPQNADAWEALLLIVAMIAGARLIAVISMRIAQAVYNSLVARVIAEIENYAISNVLSKSMAFFADQFLGGLTRKISRLAMGCEQLTQAVTMDIVPWIIGMFAGILVAGYRFPIFGIVILVWLIVISSFQFIALRRVKHIRDAAIKKDTEMGALASDILSNAMTVKTFAREQVERMRHDRENDIARSLRVRRWMAGEYIDGTQRVLNVIVEATVMILAARLWMQGALTIGDFVLFQGILLTMSDKLRNVQRLFRIFDDTVGSAREMVETLERPPQVQDVPNAKKLQIRNGAIEMTDVTFGYGDRKNFKKFSLQIAGGERVALVGASGAGKTTVIKLLMRFYDPQSGSIQIDGQEISRVTQESLRKAIALVPQEPLLFHRTLRENIAYARPEATRTQIIQAAKQARCHEFISKLPQGYDTMVGERGIKLSGGERQRVAIARAILSKSPILILDEATSSLDSESELLIQEALEELMKEKTVIVIAHRLSTIRKMDRIIVMDRGRIIDTGTHQELLGKTGAYANLWNIQAGSMTESA